MTVGELSEILKQYNPDHAVKLAAGVFDWEIVSDYEGVDCVWLEIEEVPPTMRDL